MDHNQQGGPRRGHYHRGRRGSDRRSHERRQPQPDQQVGRGNSEHVDVEQIMRDIRARIAQRHGIELSNQQVQELAARRLEAILDPRTVDPALLEQLRKSAGTPAVDPLSAPEPAPSYTFEETTLYGSHRGFLRFVRTLLRPILKLFFNPNPLIQALHIQSKVNAAAAAREREQDRRQTEWNALHYELLQRMVTDAARASLELQSLSMKVESLSAKIDFNERRVRAIEGSQQTLRPGRPAEAQAAQSSSALSVAPAATESGGPGSQPAQSLGDGQKRRRRRRRGRRGGGVPSEETGVNLAANVPGDEVSGTEMSGLDEIGPDEDGDEFESETAPPAAFEPPNEAPGPMAAEPSTVTALEPLPTASADERNTATAPEAVPAQEPTDSAPLADAPVDSPRDDG